MLAGKAPPPHKVYLSLFQAQKRVGEKIMAPHILNFGARWMLGSTSGSGSFTLRRAIVHIELGGGGCGFDLGRCGEVLAKTRLRTLGIPGCNLVTIWIFREWDVGTWTGSRGLRIRTGGGHL